MSSIKLVCFVLVLVASTARADFMKQVLGQGIPLWLIVNQTDPIDVGLIDRWRQDSRQCHDAQNRHQPFPSKYKDDLGPDASEDQKCDDGDMTNYNGMLCAVGVAEGCTGVQDAKGNDGHWFRSPRRRVFNQESCALGQAKIGDDYCDKCVKTFSPDMALGVMLYSVATKDRDSFVRWLQRYDQTRLPLFTDLSGQTILNLPWLRYCTDDVYCKKANPSAQNPDDIPGGKEISIAGKTYVIGSCTARPWDAYDFATSMNAMNAVGDAPGIQEWVQFARATMHVDQKAFAQGSVLFTGADPGFPLHLEAERILLRMLINNPSLGQGWDALLPDAFTIGLPFADPSDPVGLNLQARTLAARSPGNPFFKLLADGPTDAVRNRILELCPDVDPNSEAEQIRRKGAWLWELNGDQFDSQKNIRSGWDCVFIGSLFNKMRVKNWDLKDLLLALEKRLDPIANAIRAGEIAIGAAEGAVATAKTNLEKAQGILKATDDAFDRGFIEEQNRRKSGVDSITKKIQDTRAPLDAAKSLLDQAQNELNRTAMTIQVCVKPPVCPPKPLPCPAVCGPAPNPQYPIKLANRNQAQAAYTVLANQIQPVVNELVKQLAQANTALSEFADNIKDHARDLKDIADREAVGVAQNVLQVAQTSLVDAQKKLDDAKQENDRLSAYKQVLLGKAN